MATPGKPLDESTRKMIERLAEHGTSRREIMKAVDVARKTADKYAAKGSKKISK